MGRLGDYLLTRYSNKKFILVNWEGDRAFWDASSRPLFNTDNHWNAFRRWAQVRIDGVKEARGRYPSSTSQLYSGLEFFLIYNQSFPPDFNQPCGTSLSNRCVSSYVAPYVDPDYYFYSSWETINAKVYDGANTNLGDKLRMTLTQALNTIKAVRSGVTESNFIIGEWGFSPYLYETELGRPAGAPAQYAGEMFDALACSIPPPSGMFDVTKIPHAFFWQTVNSTPMLPPGITSDPEYLRRTNDGLFNTARSSSSVGPLTIVSSVGTTFKDKVNSSCPTSLLVDEQLPSIESTAAKERLQFLVNPIYSSGSGMWFNDIFRLPPKQ